MRPELAQVQPLAPERGKDAWHRGVQFADGKLVQPCIHAVRLHARYRRQLGHIHHGMARLVAARLAAAVEAGSER